MNENSNESINSIINNSIELKKNIQIMIEKKKLIDKIIYTYMVKKELSKINNEQFLVEIKDRKIKISEKK